MNQTKANTRLMHWMMVNQQHMNDMLADENPDYIMEHNHGVDNYMMMNRINKDSWQDTFLLLSDMRVKVALRFEDYTGIFLYHYHNLEHENMGMMRNYEVIE